MMFSKIITSIEAFFLGNWWVILFLVACLLFYEHSLRIRNIDYAILYSQWLDLQEEEKRAIAHQENLLLKINSQSDPAWVELTLMKGLGLVPEGEHKILFTSPN